jgi:hypothetical protein
MKDEVGLWLLELAIKAQPQMRGHTRAGRFAG